MQPLQGTSTNSLRFRPDLDAISIGCRYEYITNSADPDATFTGFQYEIVWSQIQSRIRICDKRILMQILDTQKHTDPTDPYTNPEH
jgi:hypothetical protein